ncbi:MAG: GDP-perosamine synthase [Parasphingorhabdus sp.]
MLLSNTSAMDPPPFLPVAEPDLSVREEEAVLDAVRSGWVSSLGRYIDEFEDSFATFCEVPYAVSVSNGTTALHLLQVAKGIGPTDEVIVPSLTFVATAAAVRHAGATPVFVDCDPILGTLDVKAVARAITEKTRAIIAVHLYGHPVDMQPLRALADKHGLFLIEDAAEAHGARCRGARVGSLGHAATFSFYGNKILTTGEGGMIVTDDPALDARLRFLRDHAMDKTRRYWHPEIGFNYRMTNLQAALGTVQLSRYDEITARRQTVLDRYRQGVLTSRFGISFNPSASWANPVPWLVTAVLPEALASHRKEIRHSMRVYGVDTRPFFIPMHLMPPYANFRRVAADGSDQLVATEALAARGLNLPSSGNLTTADIERVAEVFEAATKKIATHSKQA